MKNIFSHIGSLQSIEYSFLCYIVGPYQLSIIYIVVCIYIYTHIYQSQSTPFYPGNHFFLTSVTKFYIKMVFTGFQNTENFLKISPNIYYTIILKTQLKKKCFHCCFYVFPKALKKILL